MLWCRAYLPYTASNDLVCAKPHFKVSWERDKVGNLCFMICHISCFTDIAFNQEKLNPHSCLAVVTQSLRNRPSMVEGWGLIESQKCGGTLEQGTECLKNPQVTHRHISICSIQATMAWQRMRRVRWCHQLTRFPSVNASISLASPPPPNTLTYHTSPLQLTFLSHLTRIVQSSHIFLVSSPASSSPNLFVLCCTATLKPQPHHHTLWQSPLLQSFNLKNIWSELEGFCLHLFNAAALFVTEVQTWQSWLATVQIKRENKLLICGDKIDLLCA